MAADAALLAAVAALLLFAPAAALAVADAPIPPRTPEQQQVTASGPVVRQLPAGLPAGTTVPRTATDLESLAIRALGPEGGPALVALLGRTTELQNENDGTTYPYRFSPMVALLDRAPARGRSAAAGELGAVLMLLAARDDDPVAVNAAAAAFAVLDRARATGGCDAQLNLLLLLDSDQAAPKDDPARAEYARTERACPGDPTPGWVHGQQLSQTDFHADAEALFADLERRFPGTVGVRTGRADVHLRAGLAELSRQPFTARHELRIAEAGYRQVMAADPGSAVPGLARTLIALNDGRAAAELLDGTSHQELLVTAWEAADDFGRAESAAAGTPAQPSGLVLFPAPTLDQDAATGRPGEGDLQEDGPQSWGTGTAVPFSVILRIENKGGGASVDDVSFIPDFRPEEFTIGSYTGCLDTRRRRAAILAGHPAAALTPGPEDDGSCGLVPGFIADVARLESGRQGRGSDEVQDMRQNLWRWAGDLPHAEAAIRSWMATAAPTEPRPIRRLAEVHFLSGRYDVAADAFGTAARIARAAKWDDPTVAESLLGRGAALLRAGRYEEGTTLLRIVAEDAEADWAFFRQGPNFADPKFAVAAYHARAQLADAERGAGAARAALDDYAAARFLAPDVDYGNTVGFHPERLDGNAALAHLALGELAPARVTIDRALAADPWNPAFLMTAGFVAERTGDNEAAARYNASAVASDPGAYPAANDLGVALLRLGRHDEAVDALRRAVGARPSYALGWFNLANALPGILASQGAYARAFALDPSLRDRPHTPLIDPGIYATGLDLSKPLPAGWSLAAVQTVSPAPAAGLLTILVVGLGLARAAGAGAASTLQQWLETLADRLDRLPLLGRLHSPGWALGATVVVFVVSSLVHTRVRASETVALALGVLVLSVAGVRARQIAGLREGVAVNQRTWGPGLAFGLATCWVAPWAPLPVITTGPVSPVEDGTPAASPPRAHAALPVLLGLVAIVLFVESAAFGAPVVQALANAALVMVASALVPVGPLDGAHLNRAGLLAGTGLLGAAVLTGLALI
ncbi:hypothetical protein Acsp02_72670 [Actinoplanes sp. NBRC 103695]|nr:hypothetical protein Acsp02_72670 [Actinoplanes sp. NBRC 103695]